MKKKDGRIAIVFIILLVVSMLIVSGCSSGMKCFSWEERKKMSWGRK